jgi:hypothetical protein
VTRLSPAEHLLQELGVTEPIEIDLEAIAFHVGARVRYRPLDGCEARIIGHNDVAIITVNERSSHRRKRFSIAHELGHWRFHRGRALVCRTDDVKPDDLTSTERVADAFAADLIMPHYLFRPALRQYPKLNFTTVRNLADVFHASHTAIAIRLVEADHSPALLICHRHDGRKWFTRAPTVPARWFPKDTLDGDSFAFDVLFGSKLDDPLPRKIGADAWFDRWEAANHEVYEQTMRTGSDEILTLVLINSADMLEEQDYPRTGRRGR